MNQDTYLRKIIEEFIKWFTDDDHFSNMNIYNTIITKQNLESLSDREFLSFFYEFISEGGKVQSGGDRTKNKFKTMIEKELKTFKSYILEPFDKNFDLHSWFNRIERFPNFGVGIATIYLNRINDNIYPIMNNKTLKALNKLGYKLSSTKNFSNYNEVKKIQSHLISSFPILENFYKADSLNHFIVAEYKGQELITDFLQIEYFENTLEQNEIELDIDNTMSSKDELYQKIKDCESDSSELITIKGKIYKRYNYLMVQIKKYRNYKCQFCSSVILKENGKYYIEACHIIAKAKGGNDSLNNILVLCPNCHKLFDYAKRINVIHSKDKYSVMLNGKEYKASLE